MNISLLSAWLSRRFVILRELMALPVANLCFRAGADEHIARSFRHFTMRHPRYRLIRNKTLGAALLDLRAFARHTHYLDTVGGKGHAGPQSRKARARGYVMREIDRNAHVDAIHAINTSSALRQGRPMDPQYLERTVRYLDRPHVRYFGMFDRDGQLVAYCNVALYGSFAATERVLGYKNSDGVMYLLFTEIVGYLMQAGGIDYFMYDTMFGAQDGMRDFKRRIGFRPYRARYSLQ